MSAALETAAACCDPADAPRPARAGADPARVVSILTTNKVPLLDLPEATLPAPVRGCAAWETARAAERPRRDEQIEEFTRVAARLRAAGITCTLFKSSGTFPYRSSNLDCLVLPSRFREAARLLEEAGHIRMPHYREDHKLLFHRFRGDRSVLSVHLHEAISWGRLLILHGDGVAARAGVAADGTFAVASGPDRVIATLAHSLYETDEIRLNDLRTVRHAAGSPAFDWEMVLTRVRERGWTDGFRSILVLFAALEARVFGDTRVPRALQDRARDALRGGRWDGRWVTRRAERIARDQDPVLPHGIPKLYSKMHYFERLGRDPARGPEDRLADMGATVWNLVANRLRLRCRPAAVVSVSGLDGAGKSNAIAAVKRALETCEIPVRVVWSRGGFGAAMEALKRRGRAALPVPAAGDAEGKQRWLGGPVAGPLFAVSVLIEQGLRQIARVAIPHLAGRTILCDRYAWDTGADLIVKAGPRRVVRGVAALLVGLSRTPDLAIHLDLTPQEARARKPEDGPPGRLARQHEAMEEFVRSCGLTRIDASRPAGEVHDEVVRHALIAVCARFRGGRGEEEP